MASIVTLRIKNDEHVIGVGTTGCGKTELFRHITTASRRIVALDPKHELDYADFDYGWGLPIFAREVRTIVRPEPSDDERMARLVMECYRRRDMRIYVDELETLCDAYPITESALARVARTGRSRRVTLWSATQRPRLIPNVFKTESRVRLVFTLDHPDDRAHIAGFIGPEAEEPIDLYTFWYKRPGMLHPVLLHLDLPAGKIKEVTNDRQDVRTDSYRSARGPEEAGAAVGP